MGFKLPLSSKGMGSQWDCQCEVKNLSKKEVLLKFDTRFLSHVCRIHGPKACFNIKLKPNEKILVPHMYWVPFSDDPNPHLEWRFGDQIGRK